MSAILPAVADALDLLVAAAQAAAQIVPIIKQAQAEGRTSLTADEWAQVTGSDDSAEAALSAACAAAKAKGQ
jgi:hypothetical protein